MNPPLAVPVLVTASLGELILSPQDMLSCCVMPPLLDRRLLGGGSEWPSVINLKEFIYFDFCKLVNELSIISLWVDNELANCIAVNSDLLQLCICTSDSMVLGDIHSEKMRWWDCITVETQSPPPHYVAIIVMVWKWIDWRKNSSNQFEMTGELVLRTIYA